MVVVVGVEVGVVVVKVVVVVVVVVAYFLTEFLTRNECNDSRKNLLYLVFYSCLQNACINRVYVVASRFGMLVYRGVDVKTALNH